MNRIRLLVPRLPTAERIRPYIEQIDENRVYTNHGPLVKQLEARLAARYPGAQVVATCSGTMALQLAYLWEREQGLRAAPCPVLTFPATALAIRSAGLEVALRDVTDDTWTDGSVTTFGAPVRCTGGVIDAAPAFAEQTVAPGTTVCFSLHATKILGCGEGGYIVSHDEMACDFYRRMANFGILPGGNGRSEGMGINGKMSEYAAAVALAALDGFDREPWLRLHDWYAAHLPGGVLTQDRPRGVYPLMPVKLPRGVNAGLALAAMAQAGVECRRWYTPMIARHPLFLANPGAFPVACDLEEHLLGLPYHLDLTEADVERICAALHQTIIALGG